MEKRLLRRASALIFVLVMVLALGATPVAAQDATPTGAAMMTATELCGGMQMMDATPVSAGDGTSIEASFDLAFIDLMSVHHQGAVDMATIALERAEHGEIIALAQAIIETQQAEIAQLQEWRNSWFPGAAALSESQAMAVFDRVAAESPGMGGVPGAAEMMGSHDLMALCGANPGAFDLAFIDGMVPHHEGALLMSQSALTYAEHQELKDFASSVIAAQQAEIDQMNAWRTLWYPGATPVPA